MNGNMRQLAVLREVDRFLRAARIRYWLRGGWALDFVLGEITREHGDIDLVTWKRHEGRLRGAFQDHGFVVTPRSASVDFRKRGIDVNVLFIERGPGVVHTAGVRGEPRWRDRVLAGPPRELAGLRCRTISPQGLLEELEKTPAWLGRPPRAKHLAAMEELGRLVATDNAAARR
jgi:hypothetical protein